MNKDAITTAESQDALIAEALEAYQKAKRSGSVDKDDLKARYAPVAAELAEFIADDELVDAALTPSGGKRSTGETPAYPRAAPPLEAFGKYANFSHIKSGGMGAVYRCRDMELGRPLAMKVMHAHLASKPELVQDFREEARVASRLTHPNIAAVHEVGTLPDGRPYFTMKLVVGRTLGELLHDYHAKPTARGFEVLLRYFVAVCNAVAYAHQRRVLHRDLKPDNVMVGPFDEVQVMDWGLNKVVPRAETGPITVGADEAESVVMRPSEDMPTEPGTVRGTFEYMPPEQADPAAPQLDERCDVFALGAILCKVLTGTPPYVSAETNPHRRRRLLWEAAQACATEAAVRRLRASKAPAELTVLTERCLAKAPKDRPATAKAVAEGVTAYLAGVQKKQRAAEMRRTRRRWQLATAAILLLALTAGWGAWRVWVGQQELRRARATRDVLVAVAKEGTIRDQMRPRPVDSFEDAQSVRADWKEGLAAMEAAVEAARADDAEPAAIAAAEGLQSEFEAGLNATEARIGELKRQSAFAAGLKRATLLKWVLTYDLKPDYSRAIEGYTAAFREYGLDVAAIDPADAVSRLQTEPEPIRDLALESLEDWQFIDAPMRQRLTTIVDRLESDPWKKKLWVAIRDEDEKSMRDLVGTADPRPRQVELLGNALFRAGAVATSIRVLKGTVVQHPNDLGLQMTLGNVLLMGSGELPSQPPRPERAEAGPQPAGPAEMASAAAVCYQSALAIDPANTVACTLLGVAQARSGQREDAESSLGQAMKLDPQNIFALSSLARLKLLQMDLNQVDKLSTKILEIRPDFPEGLALRATCYTFQGRIAEAKALLDQLPPSEQKSLPVLLSRAHSEWSAGDLDAAAATYEEIARSNPNTPIGDLTAGIGSLIRGDSRAAEAALRAGLELHPSGMAGDLTRSILGMTLAFEGRLAEAETEVRGIVQVHEDDLVARVILQEILIRQGRFAEAKQVGDRLGKASAITNAGLIPGARALGSWFLTSLDQQVDAAVAHKERPSDLSLTLCAEIALLKRMSAHSLSWYRYDLTYLPSWETGFPALIGQDEGMTIQFDAGRAALLVAAGEGADATDATPDERQAARVDALKWFRAELKSKEDSSTKPSWVPKVRRFLIYCQCCPDFAVIRDQAALAKLPEAEQKDWQLFWTDVDALLKKLDAPAPKKMSGSNGIEPDNAPEAFDKQADSKGLIAPEMPSIFDRLRMLSAPAPKK